MKGKQGLPDRFSIPPKQEPIISAHQSAVAELGGQTENQLEWLGAERAGTQWRLPVMNGRFLVDTETGRVLVDGGGDVHPTWRILTLHYLAVRAKPDAQPPEVTFASLPNARTYAVVYEKRVNQRFCATAGRDASTLGSATADVKARSAEGGDRAYELDVFPRLPVRLVWYDGDEEWTPSCTLLLPANIESFFCIEDIVVLSESFVARLSGKAF